MFAFSMGVIVGAVLGLAAAFALYWWVNEGPGS